jgi:hypothetical protein
MVGFMKLPFVKINLVKSGPAKVGWFFPVQCKPEAKKSLQFLTKNCIAHVFNKICPESESMQHREVFPIMPLYTEFQLIKNE